MKPLFQSLGSQYSYARAWRHATIGAHEAHRTALKDHLAVRYDGEPQLFYKGRFALTAAFRLATGGEGGKIAVTAFTCYNLVQAVRAAGCEPVLIDIDRDHLHFGPRELEARLGQHPDIKVVLVQNSLGLPCDITGIEKIVKKHKLILIEDLAHSVGAQYDDGREVGTVGDITMLSFGRDKVIDVVNGGALVIRTPSLATGKTLSQGSPPVASRLRDRLYPLLTWHVRALSQMKLGVLLLMACLRTGLIMRASDGRIDELYGLPSWYCRLALEQFVGLEEELHRRRAIAAKYKRALEAQLFPEVVLSATHPTMIRFPLLLTEREGLLARFKAANLYLQDNWYTTVVSPARFMEQIAYLPGSCPVAEEAAESIINLPTHRGVRPEHINAIVREVQNK